jgi:hypothetical protein
MGQSQSTRPLPREYDILSIVTKVTLLYETRVRESMFRHLDETYANDCLSNCG